MRHCAAGSRRRELAFLPGRQPVRTSELRKIEGFLRLSSTKERWRKDTSSRQAVATRGAAASPPASSSSSALPPSLLSCPLRVGVLVVKRVYEDKTDRSELSFIAQRPNTNNLIPKDTEIEDKKIIQRTAKSRVEELVWTT